MLEIVRSFTEIKKLKMKNMKVELSLEEVNELIYALGVAQFSGKLVNKEVASKLEMKMRDVADAEIKRMDAWEALKAQGFTVRAGRPKGSTKKATADTESK